MQLETFYIFLLLTLNSEGWFIDSIAALLSKAVSRLRKNLLWTATISLMFPNMAIISVVDRKFSCRKGSKYCSNIPVKCWKERKHNKIWVTLFIREDLLALRIFGWIEWSKMYKYAFSPHSIINVSDISDEICVHKEFTVSESRRHSTKTNIERSKPSRNDSRLPKRLDQKRKFMERKFYSYHCLDVSFHSTNSGIK